jgi:hypothetical protein
VSPAPGARPWNWKEGYNPREQKTVVARRRRVKVDTELPVMEAYDALLRGLLAASQGEADDVAPSQSGEP